MKISFAICTHNEGHYIETLLKQLTTFIKTNPTDHTYEIVILDDYSDDEITKNILSTYLKNYYDTIRIYNKQLKGDFAEHKNFLNSLCEGDWIFNIDADEYLSDDLLYNFTDIIELNPEVQAYWVPRINTVYGLTQAHITKWNWFIQPYKEIIVQSSDNLDPAFLNLLEQYDLIIERVPGEYIRHGLPLVAWPDPQLRLYENSPDIKWFGKVHERIIGFENWSNLPYEYNFAIIHNKDIQRQEKQNNFYQSGF